MSRLSLGLGLPQLPETPGAGPLAALALKAESAGFDSLWTMEVMRPRLLDPLTVLAHVAAVTNVVKLGVAVILLPLRVPVRLARELASLDSLSNGRLIAGLGLGSRNPHLYSEHGISSEDRLDRYLSSLAVLKDLLSHGRAEYRGREWCIVGETGMPPVVQQPRPPIWLGARSDVAVRRAARESDGLITPGAATAEEVLHGLTVARDELARQGRDPASFTLAARVYVLVDPTPPSLGRMRRWFGAVYGDESLGERVTVVGGIDTVNERVAELVARGLRHVVLNPVIDVERHLDVLAASTLSVDWDTSDV